MSEDNEKGMTPEELRRTREQRITDAINLKTTDRVPVSCNIGFFAAKYAGIKFSAAYYDYEAWLSAYRKTLKDFQADIIFTREFTSGLAQEYLKPKYSRWPGYGLDPDCCEQAIEVDCLKEDEYDLFMTDFPDYMIRHHLPRFFENLEGLAMLPKLSDFSWLFPMSGQMLAAAFTDPKMEATIESLQKAGREPRKWQKQRMEFQQMLRDHGIPQYFQGAALPPYDIISHLLRGMKGTMLDMFRQPEKIHEMCEFLLEKTLAGPPMMPNEYGNTRVFMTNTRGSDNFLSMEQFNTFYWPTFKKLVMTLVEIGCTPSIFFEGDSTSRLEHLLQFPKGKVLVRLDASDIFKAKEILKNHLCIEVNVPSSLLQYGSVQEVKDYCKKLIDLVGKGGGFILGPRSSTDEVKPENLKTMIDFTKEYGRY